MKKIALSLVVIFVAAALWAQSSEPTFYVAARTVNVKESAGFFARVIETLALGDAVTLRQNQGKWLVVRTASGRQGWAPADAFSSRRILNSGYVPTSVEIAMAGKGFNHELELFLSSSGELDYSEVDAMERHVIGREEFMAFLNEGCLAAGE
jgi:hypothetical protein